MLNENADPSVRADMETFMTRVVPEGRDAPWSHTDEGYDDMPAHVKAAMFGSSLTLPIKAGRFALGTWQVGMRSHALHAFAFADDAIAGHLAGGAPQRRNATQPDYHSSGHGHVLTRRRLLPLVWRGCHRRWRRGRGDYHRRRRRWRLLAWLARREKQRRRGRLRRRRWKRRRRGRQRAWRRRARRRRTGRRRRRPKQVGQRSQIRVQKRRGDRQRGHRRAGGHNNVQPALRRRRLRRRHRGRHHRSRLLHHRRRRWRAQLPLGRGRWR